MDEYHSLIRQTFVVRLWREAIDPAWRGRIVHLPDQESIYFTTLAEVEEFIRRFVPDLRAGHPYLGDTTGVSADSPRDEPSDGDDEQLSTPQGCDCSTTGCRG